MKLLLSQREIILSNSMDIEMKVDAVERSWYTLFKDHEVNVFPNIVKVPESLEYDCLILTGGPDSIDRHLTEDALFYHAFNRNIPIVGVCHGAFAVNDLTGGINGRITGHESCFHTVTILDEIHTVNSHHIQVITTLGPEMIPVATDSDGNIEAFQHQSKPIYGIVWHPERMAEPVLIPDVKKLLNL